MPTTYVVGGAGAGAASVTARRPGARAAPRRAPRRRPPRPPTTAMPTCHDVATARKASCPTRSAGSDCDMRAASRVPTSASAGGATRTSADPSPTAPAVERSDRAEGHRRARRPVRPRPPAAPASAARPDRPAGRRRAPRSGCARRGRRTPRARALTSRACTRTTTVFATSSRRAAGHRGERHLRHAGGELAGHRQHPEDDERAAARPRSRSAPSAPRRPPARAESVPAAASQPARADDQHVDGGAPPRRADRPQLGPLAAHDRPNGTARLTRVTARYSTSSSVRAR